MTLDYSTIGKVQIKMSDYIKRHPGVTATKNGW